MGLTDKKENQLRRMPIVQSRVFKSKNGKLLIHKTTFTDIKPVAYYDKVMEAPGEEDVPEEITKVIEAAVE